MSTRSEPSRTAPRYAVHPLGCKVSQAEAGEIGRVLEAGGWCAATGEEPPDLVVVHGCAITWRAERDAARVIRRVGRESPAARIVVSGCLAQRAATAGEELPGASALLPFGAPLETGRPPSSGPAPVPGFAAVVREGRTRAFVKVQDGCNRRCTYCIVPSLRGTERSLASGAALDAVHELGDRGVPEVVLVGIHLAGFGRGNGETLAGLVGALERRPPACRVRLSSLEPMEAGEDLIDAVAGSRVIVPHLHLPLQSGSDSVLRRMRRGMAADRFRRLVERAVRANSRMHVATDVIAGFPGESDLEFQETLGLVEALPLASLHVFPFSPRPGTEAARLHASCPVAREVTARRALALRRSGEARLTAFRRRAAGTVADVVVLRGGRGLTDNYLDVRMAAPGLAQGSRLAARIEETQAGELLARPA